MEESKIVDLMLQKLDEYGEAIVGGKSKKKKQSSLAKDNGPGGLHSVSGHSIQHSPTLTERQKKKRKKKRKNEQEISAEVETFNDDDDDDGHVLSGHERRLQEMSEQLGLAEFKLEREKKKREEESIEKQKKEREPEVVVFKSYKSKKQKKNEATETDSSSTSKAPDFDMRQARFDVQKFGIKGFQGNKKDEAMTALLVKLGAKPPKKKYMNYKDYQEQRKQEMLDEKQKRETDRKLGFKVPKANRRNKRSRDRNDIGVIDGQVGRWKAGVQVVKKDDLDGIKRPRTK